MHKIYMYSYLVIFEMVSVNCIACLVTLRLCVLIYTELHCFISCFVCFVHGHVACL